MQSVTELQVGAFVQEHLDKLVELIVEDIYHNGLGISLPEKHQNNKSVRDVQFHLSYLAEAVMVNDETLFADYIAWVESKFKALSFADDIMHVIVHSMERVLENELPVGYQERLKPIFLAAWQQLSRPYELIETFISTEAPLATLAHSYLEALLKTKRNTAVQLILSHVKNADDVRDVYLNVFQPVQYEIGRLWQLNKISVAEEHFCTAVSQLIMSQLYPYIFSAPRNGKKLVAASISGELHEIGIRMVADFFEMSGWDTYYIGANAPIESIIQTIFDQKTDVIAISATISFHLSKMKQLINEIREVKGHGTPKILVGGYPFLLSPNLWYKIGADAFATNALKAVSTANQMIS